MLDAPFSLLMNLMVGLALAITLCLCLELATPVILLRAIVWPGSIRSDYEAVFDWWKERAL